MGVELDERQLSIAYDKFLKLADRKKDITDDDLLIIAGVQSKKNHTIKLEHLQVSSGKDVKPVAYLELSISGERFDATSTGNGPVDAAVSALKKIIRRNMLIREFTIQSISSGSDDIAKVHILLECEGNTYYGFGSSTDIVTASVEAYIDCINKFKH